LHYSCSNPVDEGSELVIQVLISGPYIDLCNQLTKGFSTLLQASPKIDMCSLATNDVEYSTPAHLADEMVWNTPHHSIKGKAALPSVSECYEGEGGTTKQNTLHLLCHPSPDACARQASLESGQTTAIQQLTLT